MEDRSPSSSNTVEKGDSGASNKQAACLNCRRSKTRCLRDVGALKCKKCLQAKGECIVPEYRVGRKKGIKNKRDGLEKAVFRIEQAIKRSKGRGDQSEDGESMHHLENLLNEAQRILPNASSSETGLNYQEQQLSHQLGHSLPGPDTSPDQNSDDHFEVDDAENPLQLLARASDLSGLPRITSDPLEFPSQSLSTTRSISSKEQDLRSFFGPFRPSLDIDEDVDVIDIGLTTEEEATVLFTYFHENLSHTRWGLDPLLHTPQFVRKQSAFLYTSILAASALFIPAAAALYKRLSAHCKILARSVIINRNRSPEVVLAFMINVPWMPPGKHWSDDETCSYMAIALTIALDVSLDKLIIPSPSVLEGKSQFSRAPSDCITARKALDLDGFPDVDPLSDIGKRLLRRRERIWLALFTLDRGVCLARGRSFIVPVTPLIDACDDWHRSEIADMWDGSIISSTVLRRDLVDLIQAVKQACDSNRTQNINGSVIVQSLRNMIDDFFNGWYTTWAFAFGGTKDNTIPPYVQILVAHTRLSVYSSVINHPTAPVEVKRFFRSSGLSSSLNVLRAAVQGESRLKSMPNNTCIMISFAACFAVYLSTKGQISLASSVRQLIEESAGVLERIGKITKHRNGTAALYGRHLREVVGKERESQPAFLVGQSNAIQPEQQIFPGQVEMSNPQVQMPELLQFSAMSDDQINEAIFNAGGEFEMAFPTFPMDDRTGLDWLNWFNMDVIY